FRQAWLVVLPAVLPVLDLAPWTGRFFFDESDLFLLVSCGVALLLAPHPQAGRYLSRRTLVLGGFFAATTLLALLVGLLPLSPLDANSFSSYFSHYNALRVAKGFAWGLGFFLLLRWTVPAKAELPARLFTTGILLGLLGVILIGLWERSQYAGLLDFSVPYRITASFSSMHTGGSHLPAFLALAIPFIWLWVVRRRDVISLLGGLALFSGSVYLMMSTVTRAGILALVVQLLLLGLLWLRALQQRGRGGMASALALLVMIGGTGSVLLLGSQSSFLQQRLSTVEQDAQTRLDHWSLAYRMMDEGPATSLFGMGLGTFPETFLFKNPSAQVPGNFRYASEGDNTYLALGAGETLYLAQRVAVEPNTRYRLSFEMRGEGKRLQLTIPLCEKHLLNSRDCVWKSYQAEGRKGWQQVAADLNSGDIGGTWLHTPPVELFLYNAEPGQVVEVDNLSLRAPDGSELLRNGDFSAGGDHWFFKTHEHLAWHIKNLWVSLLFEQGWAGLLAFNLFLLAVTIQLGRQAWAGNAIPAATLTALIGFLTLGLFASPFDAPRLTSLFFAVTALGLHATPWLTARGPSPRPGSQPHRSPD
ncbi:MAG: O-antigen ligase family protein, partial [Halieaceae bacterium]|nr:O-antigen ligase family protein [Halieaceae bacterium]